MGWAYLLKCADGTYYAGSTQNLDLRVWQHSTGLGAKYTSKRLPIELVFAAEFGSIAEAYAFEKKIQGWSRAKREALIAGEFNKLPELSKKRFGKAPERPR